MPKPACQQKLILASRSSRRRELLVAAGYRFEVCLPSESAEGGSVSGESPAELVARLAYQKADDVVRQLESGQLESGQLESGQLESGQIESGLIEPVWVLGCDTVAECDGQILGKPDDRRHARQMLQTLSGREHRVHSGLCLYSVPDGQPAVRTAVTTLRMDPLSDEQLEEYLCGGGWKGKAGAFGYQDRLGWVHVIEGSESNVVGLPLELLAEMLP